MDLGVNPSHRQRRDEILEQIASERRPESSVHEGCCLDDDVVVGDERLRPRLEERSGARMRGVVPFQKGVQSGRVGEDHRSLRVSTKWSSCPRATSLSPELPFPTTDSARRYRDCLSP